MHAWALIKLLLDTKDYCTIKVYPGQQERHVSNTAIACHLQQKEVIILDLFLV